MTFPPILLIDEHRVGRKKLMIGSALVMSLSSACSVQDCIRLQSRQCSVHDPHGGRFQFWVRSNSVRHPAELVPSRVSFPSACIRRSPTAFRFEC